MAESRTIPRLTPVSIGAPVSARAMQADPVAAGLSALQSALAHGVDRWNAKEAEVKNERLQQLENIYEAYEQSDIEKTETELAQDVFDKIGVDVHSLTRSHVRRTNEGTGRIRGRTFTQDIEGKVESGEIKTVGAFEAAWNEGVDALDKEFPDNDALKVGFLERSGQMYRPLQAAVFKADLEGRKAQSLDVLGQEMMGEFEALMNAADHEEGVQIFTQNTAQLQIEHEAKFQNASPEEVESTFLDTLATAALNASVSEGVAEAAELLLANNTIHTSGGKKTLAIIRRQAQETSENFYAEPSREIKEQVSAKMNAMTQHWVQKKEFRPQDYDELLKLGGPWAAQQWRPIRASIESGAGIDETTYTPNMARDLERLYTFVRDGDVKAIDEYTRQDGWLKSMTATPAGTRVVEKFFAAAENIRDDAGQFMRDAYDRIGKKAFEEEWDSEYTRSVERAYTKQAEALSFKVTSESQTELERLLSNASVEWEKKNTPKPQPSEKPGSWHEAKFAYDTFGERYRAAQAEAEQAHATLQQITSTLTPARRGPFPRSRSAMALMNPDTTEKEDQLDRRAAIVAHQAAVRKETDLLKKMNAAERAMERHARRLPAGGMSAEQALYFQLYGGSADATDMVNQLRHP